MIVSFQVHCGGVQSQNDDNCVNVLIYTDLTVLFTALVTFTLSLIPAQLKIKIHGTMLRSVPISV